MTKQYHMNSHEGTYTKEFEAKVEATFPGIIDDWRYVIIYSLA